MKFWKNLPYWLKGGIITTILCLIIALALVPFGDDTGGYLILPYWFIPTLIGSAIICTPFVWIFGPLAWDNINDFFFHFGFAVTGIIFYFLIGAIIGWIYGKIRNRKISNDSKIT